MKTSPAGIDLIRRFEGLRLESYLDAAQPPRWTVGWGHCGPDICQGLTITEEAAMALLEADLAKFEAAVSAAVTVPLTQDMFDALVAWTFNCGVKALLGSTLLKKLNTGDYLGAADEVLRWTRAGSVTLPGLLARRQAERALFLSGPAPSTSA